MRRELNQRSQLRMIIGEEKPKSPSFESREGKPATNLNMSATVAHATLPSHPPNII